MIKAFSITAIFLLSMNLYASDANMFMENVSKHMEKYNEFISQPETRALFIEGKVSESDKQLKALVPDNKKTIYDYFILGNMLYKNDREASYSFMIMAEKKEPENPYIAFERGIHEHRLGNYSSAQAYYERLRNTEPFNENPALNAYLTHSYLMTGQPEKAFASWKKANFNRHHISIEKAMYTIFSKSDQENKRESLISDIQKGEKQKLCDLYKLDSEWEIDWWNYNPKESYLEYDRKLATTILENGTTDKKYFDLCSLGEGVANDIFVERLKEMGFFGKSIELPESSSLIYVILKRLAYTKSMSPGEFLNKYESQLVALSKKYPNDRKYFDVLAFLYAQTGNHEKLKTIDRYGWKELKIENYALSFIAGVDRKSEQYKTLISEALEDFPLSASINRYRLSDETQDKKAALLKFVASQFANVKNHVPGRRLNDYMASLRHELKKLEQ